MKLYLFCGEDKPLGLTFNVEDISSWTITSQDCMVLIFKNDAVLTITMFNW